MKGCPQCESPRAWLLGDGRCKCRSCGLRYSWKSVWDSVRLNESIKQSLLRQFIDGVPASRGAGASGACADSRERFYRLVRACCSLQGSMSKDALYLAECPHQLAAVRSSMRGWATTQRVIVIGIAEHAGIVQISAPNGSSAQMLPILRERSAVGGVVRVMDSQAYATLPVHGEYVIVPRVTRAPLEMHPVEAFWHQARSRLQIFRKIPLKFFALYLGETCLRFNQRDSDLYELLSELLRTTSIGDVKPMIMGLGGGWDTPGYRSLNDDGSRSAQAHVNDVRGRAGLFLAS